MQKKVSIITPCLNGEKFVKRYLDSILNQTYKNIELIFVNDGSSDKTENIVKMYIDKFSNNGMKLIYIYQNNMGQAAALNRGLKIFSGEYLTWPDSDDFLPKDSIEKKVNFLEKNDNYGIVRTDAYEFNENNLKVPIGFLSCKTKNRFKENLFVDFIIERDVWFAPGCFMVKTSSFLDVNPNREIYESSAGQNWQMLLPLMYKYKCGYIDEPLYNYVIRRNSHSRSNENIDLESCIKKYNIHEDVLRNVINSMNIDKTYYNNLITQKYARRKLDLGAKYRNRKLLFQQYNLLKSMKCLSKHDKITYIRGLFYIFELIYEILRSLKSKFQVIKRI